jgi:hypothetical protein
MGVLVSARAQAIDAYISQNPTCEKNASWPMEFGGRIEYAPVFALPTKLLCYNLDNGRYAVELARLQADEGYQLDPTTERDRAKLRELLLSLDKEQTALLKQDIEERGQVYPGVITRAGFVVNANRRMAVLEALHAEHPSKYETLLVQRLPEGTSEIDLWRLEAGLQLSQNTRSDYSPVNELLKLRKGRDAGLSPKELAAAMFGRKPAWVEESLERLALMEQYLLARNQEGQHHALDGKGEQFIEMQRNLKSMERDGISVEEKLRWVEFHFKAIDSNLSNWQLRKVREMYVDDDATKLLLEVVDQETSTVNEVVNAFKAAQTTIESKEEKNEPKLLLQRAHAILTQIDLNHAHLNTPDNRYFFKKIRSAVKALEGIFGT